MRLYPKRLRNIEDLEKEKLHLIQKSKRLDKEEFLTIESLIGKKKGEGKGGSKESSLLDYLPISNPIVSFAVKMIQRQLSKKSEKPKVVYAPAPLATEKKETRSKVKAIAIEFIGGYLKWKAIELTYKGIKHLVRKSKEKNEVEK